MPKKTLIKISLFFLCLSFTPFIASCSTKKVNYDQYNNINDIINNQNGWYTTKDDDFTNMSSDEFNSKYTCISSTREYGDITWETTPDCVNLIQGKGIEISSYKDSSGEMYSGLFTTGDPTWDHDLFAQKYGFFSITMSWINNPIGWDSFYLVCGKKSGDVSKKEVDIVETPDYEHCSNYSTNVYTNYGPFGEIGPWKVTSNTDLSFGTDESPNFHTYSLVWTPSYYAFYIDDKPGNEVYFSIFNNPIVNVPLVLKCSLNLAPGQHNWMGNNFQDWMDNTHMYVLSIVCKQNTNFPS